jgi:hypothetical protein
MAVSEIRRKGGRERRSDELVMVDGLGDGNGGARRTAELRCASRGEIRRMKFRHFRAVLEQL